MNVATRAALAIAIALPIASCSVATVSVKKEVIPNKSGLEGDVGQFRIYMGTVSEGAFPKLIKKFKDDTIADRELSGEEKARRVRLLDGLQWQPNKYYYWAFQYKKAIPLDVGRFTLTVVDNANRGAGMLYFKENTRFDVTRMVGFSEYSNEFSEVRLYFMLDFPMLKQKAQMDRLPLTVTCSFLDGNRVEYDLRFR